MFGEKYLYPLSPLVAPRLGVLNKLLQELTRFPREPGPSKGNALQDQLSLHTPPPLSPSHLSMATLRTKLSTHEYISQHSNLSKSQHSAPHKAHVSFPPQYTSLLAMVMTMNLEKWSPGGALRSLLGTSEHRQLLPAPPLAGSPFS